jgi:hypothetical protein
VCIGPLSMIFREKRNFPITVFQDFPPRMNELQILIGSFYRNENYTYFIVYFFLLIISGFFMKIYWIYWENWRFPFWQIIAQYIQNSYMYENIFFFWYSVCRKYYEIGLNFSVGFVGTPIESPHRPVFFLPILLFFY